MLAQSAIDQYNEKVLASHRVALDGLCRIIAESSEEDDDTPAPRRHIKAERTKLPFQACVTILRTRLIKDPRDKAPPRTPKVVVGPDVAKLIARSPALRERHADALVAGDRDLAGLGVDRGHRPPGQDDLADDPDAAAHDREGPVLVHHQGAQ